MCNDVACAGYPCDTDTIHAVVGDGIVRSHFIGLSAGIDHHAVAQIAKRGNAIRLHANAVPLNQIGGGARSRDPHAIGLVSRDDIPFSYAGPTDGIGLRAGADLDAADSMGHARRSHGICPDEIPLNRVSGGCGSTDGNPAALEPVDDQVLHNPVCSLKLHAVDIASRRSIDNDFRAACVCVPREGCLCRSINNGSGRCNGWQAGGRLKGEHAGHCVVT